MQSFLLPIEADKKTEYGHQATFEELQKTWPQEYTTFTLTLQSRDFIVHTLCFNIKRLYFSDALYIFSIYFSESTT
jgi:hypothetical protein